MQDNFDKSGSFLASQLRQMTESPAGSPHPLAGPAVTISHQTGAGAHEVGQRLAELLQETEPPGTRPWTVLDRQLVEKALEEHHWPKQLAHKMPEDRRTYIDDVLDDLFGLRPPSWVLVPQVAETMLHLVEAGRVILIGRGATAVTARVPGVFHVRLVASLPTRIGRVEIERKLTREAAARHIDKEDRGRQRYVKANFHVRLDDDLLYDLVVNTDRVSCGDAAGVIASAARRYFENQSPGRSLGPVPVHEPAGSG